MVTFTATLKLSPSNTPSVCRGGPLICAGLRKVTYLLGHCWPLLIFPPFLCSGLATNEMIVWWWNPSTFVFAVVGWGVGRMRHRVTLGPCWSRGRHDFSEGYLAVGWQGNIRHRPGATMVACSICDQHTVQMQYGKIFKIRAQLWPMLWWASLKARSALNIIFYWLGLLRCQHFSYSYSFFQR